VYVAPGAQKHVDLYCDTVALPRCFEWNLMHHKLFLSHICMDVDGVLCRDPSEDENDDGPRYRRFVTSAQPFYLPTHPVGWLVTSRLEKYRRETVEWLACHGVEYGKLIMMEYPDMKARQAANTYAQFKAATYLKTGAWLFVLAMRDSRRIASAALIGAATVLVLFLAALRSFGTFPGRSTEWDHVGQGAMLGLLICLLAASAAVLIARMEPASVLLARRRWHQARAEHAAAVRLEHADDEAASVAREAWLRLVRTHASTVATASGNYVVHDSVVLASALQDLGRPRMGPEPAGF
jgi:hypothetical protein